MRSLLALVAAAVLGLALAGEGQAQQLYGSPYPLYSYPPGTIYGTTYPLYNYTPLSFYGPTYPLAYSSGFYSPPYLWNARRIATPVTRGLYYERYYPLTNQYYYQYRVRPRPFRW